jgi:hypothetical protein
MSHIKLKDILSEVHQTKLDEGILDIFKKIFPSKPTNLDNLTPEQRKILYDYTKAGYTPINRHLRNKYGEKDITPDRTYKEYDPKEIEDKIGIIAAAFTKENTNQKQITVYTGITPEFGEKLIKSIGQTLNFSGFTSTSLDRNIALNFGEKYANNPNEVYIIKCICPPHTALDIQKISHNKFEKEHLINYGAKFEVLSHDSDAAEYIHEAVKMSVHEITIKLLGEQVSYK